MPVPAETENKGQETMKRQDFERDDSSSRILGRDGFSPDVPLAARGSGRGVSLGLKLLMYMISGLRIGSLEVTLPDGSRREFAGSEPGPHGVWQINSSRLIRHVLSAGEVGIGDSYLDNCWESPDLARLLLVLHLTSPITRVLSRKTGSARPTAGGSTGAAPTPSARRARTSNTTTTSATSFTKCGWTTPWPTRRACTSSPTRP